MLIDDKYQSMDFIVKRKSCKNYYQNIKKKVCKGEKKKSLI